MVQRPKHPARVPSPFLPAPPPAQVPADAPGKQTWPLCPGSRRPGQPGPGLATAVIRGVYQQMQALSLLLIPPGLSPHLSAFQINIFIK